MIISSEREAEYLIQVLMLARRKGSFPLKLPDLKRRIPMSWSEVLEIYQPLPWENRLAFERQWMRLFYFPESFKPAKRVYCNKVCIPDLELIFEEIEKEGLMGEFKTFDGCFNIRKIRGSSNRWSLHSFGLAFDFNAFENRVGTNGNMHPKIVEIFLSYGWAWGGHFERKDPMHFQRAHNC